MDARSARRRAALLAALLALAVVPRGILACSSAVVNDSGSVASFRTMDFGHLPDNLMVWAPSGLVIPFVPLLGTRGFGPLGANFTTKHSFVCLSPLHSVMSSLVDLKFDVELPQKAWPGVCADGLNDAGLAASLQWQRDTNKVNAYSGAGPAVNQMDFVNWVLATFSRAADVKAAIDKGLQVTWNKIMDLGATWIVGFPYIPCHMHILDASGASVVVQWDAQGRVQALDNPLGVLANHPRYEQQVQHYKWWTSRVSAPPYSSIKVLHGGAFTAFIGSYNQSDRFTRLAMLRSAAGAAPWPAPVRSLHSPLHTGDGVLPATNGALMAAMGLMHSVWLPKGVDDSSGVGGEASDWTLWATLRDHTLRTFYYRTANSPQWQAVRLPRVDWAKLRAAKRLGTAPMRTLAWAADASSGWL